MNSTFAGKLKKATNLNFIAIVCFLVSPFAAAVTAIADQPQQNIILIVVDDLGFADLSFKKSHASDVATPSIDQLAKQSTYFDNAYVTAPICNISRISILTGRYHQRVGAKWYGGPGISKFRSPTIPELLRPKGYATAMVGKVHHGSDNLRNRNHPLNHGYDFFYGFQASTKHYLKHKEQFKNPKARALQMGPMMIDKKPVDTEGFATELFGNAARRFISENQSKPFFLHLSFNAVHNFTHQLPDEYLKKKGLTPFPDYDPEKETYWEWRSRLSYPANKYGRGYYLGQLEYLDSEIGKLLNQLDELKIASKTTVILISDNGGSLVTYAKNNPLSGGKYTLLEGGIRVPLLIKSDRFSRGETEHRMVSSLDLLPTIVEIAGAKLPEKIDGQSLLKKPEDDRKLFWDTGSQLAIRAGTWKLLITNKPPNSRLQIAPTPRGTFLYDLRNDPGEQKNLASENPDVVKELRTKLEDWQVSVKPQQTKDNK